MNKNDFIEVKTTQGKKRRQFLAYTKEYDGKTHLFLEWHYTNPPESEIVSLIPEEIQGLKKFLKENEI